MRDTTAALLSCARQRLVQHHRSCVGAFGTAAAECIKEGRVGIKSQRTKHVCNTDEDILSTVKSQTGLAEEGVDPKNDDLQDPP